MSGLAPKRSPRRPRGGPVQAAVLVCLAALPACAGDFYVSPDGSPRGEGTVESPWDLQTALDQPRRVRPGDTIWLCGGTYKGAFASRLSGTAADPIVVRGCPGERVTLDRAGSDAKSQPALTVNGSGVWYWGLEITNSSPDRGEPSPFTGLVRPWRGDGVDVYGPDNKFINMVFHDNGSGIYDKSDGTEISGCLFYYNGNNKFEHGLYLGNSHGTKRVCDNIVFDQAGFGIHSFSASDSSGQSGIVIEGNVVFNNGSLLPDDRPSANIILGGVRGVPAERARIARNAVYSPPRCPRAKSQGIQAGYADQDNADLRLLDNYVVGLEPLKVYWWREVECRGNTLATPGAAVYLKVPDGARASAYAWDRNRYVAPAPPGVTFVVGDGAGVDFRAWRALTGLDAGSAEIVGPRRARRTADVLLRPNAYEPGRANIAVFNPGLLAAAEVDVSGVLSPGDPYEVLDAQNWYGAPVLSGVYDGRPLRVPLRPGPMAAPTGGVQRTPAHTAPEFAVFVIRRR